MTFIIAILLAPFALLTFSFAIEVFVGLRPLPPPTLRYSERPKAVTIVPAHDEEAVIGASLKRLKSAAQGLAKILVVADNCADRTAQIGRELGLEVIERSDSVRKGKGFALDFARSRLESDPPDVVLIVDADCAIDAKSLECLIRSSASLGRPCQATNLQQPAADASPAVQLSTFAFFIKNVVRQRALQRIARRAHLLGTGMALPWPVFAAAELASSNIVEDLKLGQDLSARGHAPFFVEQATVWSNAETEGNTISQRRRWEGGFLQNALRSGPPMLARAIRSADARLLWAAINTTIPPFALLILVDVAALLVAALLTWLLSAAPWPALVLGAALLLALVAIGCAWTRGGSRFVSLSSLARAPLYVAWKLPMYMGLARKGAPKEWVRTGR